MFIHFSSQTKESWSRPSAAFKKRSRHLRIVFCKLSLCRCEDLSCGCIFLKPCSFPFMGVPNNGWLIREIPLKYGWFGGPPVSGYLELWMGVFKNSGGGIGFWQMSLRRFEQVNLQVTRISSLCQTNKTKQNQTNKTKKQTKQKNKQTKQKNKTKQTKKTNKQTNTQTDRQTNKQTNTYKHQLDVGYAQAKIW